MRSIESLPACARNQTDSAAARAGIRGRPGALAAQSTDPISVVGVAPVQERADTTIGDGHDLSALEALRANRNRGDGETRRHERADFPAAAPGEPP